MEVILHVGLRNFREDHCRDDDGSHHQIRAAARVNFFIPTMDSSTLDWMDSLSKGEQTS